MFHLEMAIYFSRETGKSCSETETSLEVEGKKMQKTIFCFSVLWKHFNQIHSYADIPCKYDFKISLLKFNAYGTLVSKEQENNLHPSIMKAETKDLFVT